MRSPARCGRPKHGCGRRGRREDGEGSVKRDGAAAVTRRRVHLDGPDGRLLGTVVEEADHWRASMMIAGQLHQQYFDSLDETAAWLRSIAPK
jgi:hypothetical protein